MTVSLIAAIAANRVIGSRGRLPWRIPDDMARFRHLTTGHPVIMGRATFDSLGRADSTDVPGRAPLGRALPGRTNIVLTRAEELRAEGCIVTHGPDEALAAAAAAPGADEVFVIGGASVYALFLPRASRLYVTWIDAAVSGDSLFPEVAWNEWRMVRETAGPAAPLPHRFTDYERTR